MEKKNKSKSWLTVPTSSFYLPRPLESKNDCLQSDLFLPNFRLDLSEHDRLLLTSSTGRRIQKSYVEPRGSSYPTDVGRGFLLSPSSHGSYESIKRVRVVNQGRTPHSLSTSHRSLQIRSVSGGVPLNSLYSFIGGCGWGSGFSKFEVV